MHETNRYYVDESTDENVNFFHKQLNTTFQTTNKHFVNLDVVLGCLLLINVINLM